MMIGLGVNMIGLIIFIQMNEGEDVYLSKYLFGLGIILISNLLIEASSVTFIMKNLAHYIPS